MDFGTVLSVLIAAWAAWDARKRFANWIAWGLATLFAWPITVPYHLAKRSPCVGETRAWFNSAAGERDTAYGQGGLLMPGSPCRPGVA